MNCVWEYASSHNTLWLISSLNSTPVVLHWSPMLIYYLWFCCEADGLRYGCRYVCLKVQSQGIYWSLLEEKIFRCVKHTLALQTQSTTVWEKKKYFGCMDHNSFLKCSLGNASDLYIGLCINVNTAKYRWATNQGKTLTLIWLHLSPRSSSDHLYSPQFTDHEGHWLM